jgi:hypothetical protein
MRPGRTGLLCAPMRTRFTCQSNGAKNWWWLGLLRLPKCTTGRLQLFSFLSSRMDRVQLVSSSRILSTCEWWVGELAALLSSASPCSAICLLRVATVGFAFPGSRGSSRSWSRGRSTRPCTSSVPTMMCGMWPWPSTLDNGLHPHRGRRIVANVASGGARHTTGGDAQTKEPDEDYNF